MTSTQVDIFDPAVYGTGGIPHDTFARLRLTSPVARFDDPEQPYLSRVAPQFVKARVSDYDHLARVFEWSTSGEEGEE